ASMATLMEFIEAVRALRAVPRLPRHDLRPVSIAGADDAFVRLLQAQQPIVETLARTPSVTALRNGDGRPPHALSRRIGGMEVLLPVDAAFIEKERAALNKEMEKARAEIESLERKLSAKGFIEKAPSAVVEKERDRLAALRALLAMSSERLASL
ncbi:MAG TPA: hypothetical protein VKR99_07715, partial [Candidatus Eremiobacteraceae bacterium]|nr:hypothetical protein [Candidatus Eremiobacteraceae bacterium]